MPVITFLCPCFPLNYFLNIYKERITYEELLMKIFVESFLVNMQIIQFIPAEIYFK